MAEPSWSHKDPADPARVIGNCRGLLDGLRAAAPQRTFPDASDVRAWHSAVFAGCTVPIACYIGTFRGDPTCPELFDYEVGIGPTLGDGYPERVGVWSDMVSGEVAKFFQAFHEGLRLLDTRIPVGVRPTTVDLLHEVVALVAVVHGEWVRIHPFANGNVRTARLLGAFISLRYGLPVFVRLRPRPDDVAYARAAKRSMGRPPDFAGDHQEAIFVFTHML